MTTEKTERLYLLPSILNGRLTTTTLALLFKLAVSLCWCNPSPLVNKQQQFILIIIIQVVQQAVQTQREWLNYIPEVHSTTVLNKHFQSPVYLRGMRNTFFSFQVVLEKAQGHITTIQTRCRMQVCRILQMKLLSDLASLSMWFVHSLAWRLTFSFLALLNVMLNLQTKSKAKINAGLKCFCIFLNNYFNSSSSLASSMSMHGWFPETY